jgi:hypothetical protein
MAHTSRALKPSYLRRGSADTKTIQRPVSSFNRRSSGSHALDKTKNSLTQPFSPLRTSVLAPALRLTSVSPESSLALSQLSFNLHVPQTASSPTRFLPDLLQNSSFSCDFPNAFSTPVSKKQPLLTPPGENEFRTPTVRREQQESPTPKPRLGGKHHHVKLPEDSIFTASLELSVSPTVKQSLFSGISSALPIPGNCALECIPFPSLGKHAEVQMADQVSPDVLNLFAQVNINGERRRYSRISALNRFVKMRWTPLFL